MRLLFTISVALLAGCTSTQYASRYAEWASYAGSPDSAQYSSLSEVNRSNVRDLEVAWQYPAGDANHRMSPLVIGRTMYVVARGGIAALDAETGAEQWFLPDSVAVPLRGFGYWEDETGNDRRLFAIKDHYLQAVDADTGTYVDEFGEEGRIDLRENLGRDPETIPRVTTMTPGRVFEDLIIMGSAVGDETYGGAPGDVRAYDVRNGELVWTFHTIPHPGEFGYETWPPDAWKTIGAANAWTNMAIDETRGLVFIPTGAPSYHFYGANRVGDNLFSNSLVVLNARTGERVWHFQAIHHDIWDYDIAMGPKLLTVERNGQEIDSVALAGKHALLYVFNRETGEPVFPIEERPVPQSDVPGEVASPTQPFPVTPPPFARTTLSADELSPYAPSGEIAALAERIREARNEGLFTPPSFQGSVNAPGSRGGAQFGNGAVIPDKGLFFMAVIESPTIPKLVDRRSLRVEDYESTPAAELYGNLCSACHGTEGRGQPPLFPALTGLDVSKEEFDDLVLKGRGRMAAFPNLPEAQLEALWVHVLDIENAEASGEPEPLPEEREYGPDDGPYRSGYHHFFTEDGLLGPTPWSKLMAFDLNEGTVLWEKPYGDVIGLAERGITGTGSLFPTNSLVATAGGLLFSTTNDRKIRAWDQDTGEVLWTHDLPADPAGMSAVFELDGRQFITVSATRDDRSGRPAERAYITFALPE